MTWGLLQGSRIFIFEWTNPLSSWCYLLLLRAFQGHVIGFLLLSDMSSWGFFCRVRVVIVGMVSSLGGHWLRLCLLCPSADDVPLCCLSLFVLGWSSSEKGSSSTPVSTSLLCSLCMWTMSSTLTRTPWLLSQLKYFTPLKVPLWFP